MKRLTSGTRRLLGLGLVVALVLSSGALPATATRRSQDAPVQPGLDVNIGG